MEKALVTGCAGFIGSHLTEKLLEIGMEVIGIDCFTDYYSRKLKENNIINAIKHDSFKLIEENILKINEFPEVDYVFHLAAQPGVRKSWGRNFQIYTKNNIDTTQNLLEYYKNKDINKFIYSSSSSIYGDSELPMREETIPKPVSPYGVSKLAAEHLCYLYWKNHDISTVSLRYFTVYGPRQRPDMAIHLFVKSVLNDEEITIFGDGEQTRDFTFVNDAVNANILAAHSESSGEVFNIGGGSKISVNQLIDKIEKLTARDAHIKYVEKQKGDVRDTLADTSKSFSLGWKSFTNIDKGLYEYIKWYNVFYDL